MITLTLEEQETLRHAVMDYIVERQGMVFAAQGVRRGLERRHYVDFSIEDAHVQNALVMLAGMGMVTGKYDDMGSTTYYTATPQGILSVERRQADRRV